MYKRILIVIGDRPEALAALDEGLGLAKVHGAEALLLHVMPRNDVGVIAEAGMISMPLHEDAERALREQAERLLSEASARAERRGVRSHALLCTGDPVTSITTAARERSCDLIVAGAEQHNAVMRILTGSAIPGLITQAPVPVLVCHERVAAPPGGQPAEA